MCVCVSQLVSKKSRINISIESITNDRMLRKMSFIVKTLNISRIYDYNISVRYQYRKYNK